MLSFFSALLATLSLWASHPRLAAWGALDDRVHLAGAPGAAQVWLAAGEAPPGATPRVLLAAPGPRELDERQSLRYVGPADHPFALLDWNSAPQVALWEPLNASPGERVLLETASGRPLWVEGPGGARSAIVFAGVEPSAEPNRQLLEWPALPFVLYAATHRAAGQPHDSFYAWDRAPVPRGGAVTAWIVGAVAGLSLLSLVLFGWARRAGARAPDLGALFAPPPRAEAGARAAWDKPSFARPLAGFLFTLVVQVLLLLSLGYLTEVIFPNSVQPFPFADGMLSWVGTSFAVVWYLFDAGTRDAFVKLFAEKRHRDPAGALRVAQFFVWWQLLTGVLQLWLVTYLVLGPMPESSYALFAWPLLATAAGQWPGVQNIFSAYLQAAQRFDYAQAVELIASALFGLVMPLGAVLLGRSWGAAHPAYGEAFGALLGLACSSYLTQLGGFGVGFWLARRAGLPIRPLFYASFDRATAREALWYGLRMTLGQLPNRLSFAINSYVLKARILNYGELSGLYGRLDGNFLKYFKWPMSFYSAGVPAVAEALGENNHDLARHYGARFLQYGMLFSAIVAALVLAAGDPFVRYALDPQWGRISDYLPLAVAVGLLLCPAWVADALLQGAGRPGRFGALVAGEQAARVLLFLALVDRFQFTGFLLAIGGPLLLKTALAWWMLRGLVPVPFSWRRHALGPLAVGLCLFALLAPLGWLVSSGWAASLLLFGGGAAALLLGFFFAGLFHLLDDAAQQELADAATMTGPVLSWIARALPWAAALGRRASWVS